MEKEKWKIRILLCLIHQKNGRDVKGGTHSLVQFLDDI